MGCFFWCPSKLCKGVFKIMVLSRTAQDTLSRLSTQEESLADTSQAILTFSLTRSHLQSMCEEDVLHYALMIYRLNHLQENERRAIGKLIGTSEQQLSKVLSGAGHIGGEAWGIIEKAIGIDIYEIWRNVKKGKP